MRRTAIITAGVLLGAGLLAGCGGGDDDKKADGGSGGSGGDSYCDTLKGVADDIKSFTADNATPDFSKFDDFIDIGEDLQDKAPGELEDDWKVVVSGMKDLKSALDDAGLSMEDFGSAMASGELPEGVSQEDLAELSTKIQEIGGDEITEANEAISAYSKDECKVDLSTTE